jgi:threonine aldolase
MPQCPPLGRQEGLQIQLDPVGVLVPGKAQPPGQSLHVSVHRKVGLIPDVHRHHPGGLRSHPGKCCQLGPRRGDLSPVPLHQRRRHALEGTRFGAEEAAASDEPFQLGGVRRGQRAGVGVAPEHLGGDHVHPLVGALGREDDGDHELQGRGVVQLDPGFGHRFAEPVQDSERPATAGGGGLARHGVVVVRTALPMTPIDLRSDTVTRPTPAMRRAMAEAEVGDDVYGEDPNVHRLEERIAERLGFPAALFVPSGTQGNQVAVGVHCRPGEEVILEEGSHAFHYENGALAALWGVQPRVVTGRRGLFTADQVRTAFRGQDDHLPRSRLLVLENTHNRGGGTVWPLGQFREVVEVARAVGLRIHLDGARLFNAEVALGTPASAWSSLTDSTTVCFSKGLGAPVGSVLAGGREFIAEGRRLRKRLGGGMRQAGILAAACLYALEHHLARLAEDHANARFLAERLADLPGVSVELDRVETNMVYAEVPVEAPALVPRLRAAGLLVNAVSPHAVRLVCHLDVSREDVGRAVQIVAATLRSG